MSNLDQQVKRTNMHALLQSACLPQTKNGSGIKPHVHEQNYKIQLA